MPLDQLEVMDQNAPQRIDQRDDALLVSLAADAHLPVVVREIVAVEGDQFREADSAAVEHGHGQRVAHGDEIFAAGASVDVGDHVGHAAFGDEDGQTARRTQRTDAPEDILRDDSLPAQVMPQCPKRRHLAVHRRRADVRFFGAVENPFTNVLGAQLRRVERRLVDSQPRQKPFDVAAVVADSERGVTAFGFEVCQEFGEHLRQRYNYFAGK